MLSPFIIAIIIASVTLILAILLAIGYTKAPPDKAVIISGILKTPRILIGRAGFMIPFFERKDELTLKLVSVDVKTTDEVPTADFINIRVDAAVNLKIDASLDNVKLAQMHFLNKMSSEISETAKPVLEGNLREIIGQMKLVDMIGKRDEVANKVAESAKADFARMGLSIVSFNIQNFYDENDVIKNLGIDRIVTIQKDAAISRAKSEKDIKVSQAENKKIANDAVVSSETEISVSQNALVVKQSELKQEAEAKKAIADASYEIQKEIQSKQILTASAEAQIAQQEKLTELVTKKVATGEQALRAEICNRADADKYAIEQAASADLFKRRMAAEANFIEVQQAANATIEQAKADRIKKEQEAVGEKALGESRAAVILAEGTAKAESIRLAGLGEAAGLDKKADAMAKMQEAAIAEMYFNALPSVARSLSEPMSKIDSITMFGEGNTSKLMQDMVNSLQGIMNGVSTGAGIPFQSILAGLLGGKIAQKTGSSSEKNKEETSV